jgi:hypothetical protein
VTRNTLVATLVPLGLVMTGGALYWRVEAANERSYTLEELSRYDGEV